MIDSDLTDISLDYNRQDYNLKVGLKVYNLDWVGSFFFSHTKVSAVVAVLCIITECDQVQFYHN